MPTPISQLLSRTSYAGDGVTTAWNFVFADGYIDITHVKAYTQTAAGVRTDLTLTEDMFTGPFQLTITPPVADGDTLTIYRDSLNLGVPLVDFTDGGNLTEAALDTLAKQAVFVAAEGADALALVVGPELEATAAQVALDAAAAAASAVAAAASAVDAAEAATDAAADAAAAVLPTVMVSIQPSVDAAAASALAAAASATAANLSNQSAGNNSLAAAASAAQADTSADIANAIASSLSGSFGFDATSYDFGFVTDLTTYLDLDCGTVP